MSSTTVAPPITTAPAQQAGHSKLLVFFCTIIGAAAQMFIKKGSSHSAAHGFEQTAVSLVTNLPLLTGYSLYAVNTFLLMLSLRKGELSVLYPIIALTYVWVTILSVFLLHEEMNWLKVSGLILIVVGVSVLGRKGKQI